MAGNIAAGILFVLAAGFFGAFLYLMLDRGRENKQERKRLPWQRKKEAEADFPENFVLEVDQAYKKEENIQGMLEELLERYPQGKIHEKLEKAKDYLLNSRYKDYETTLYHYLSDGSEELKELYAKIILKEIAKRMRLPMKE